MADRIFPLNRRELMAGLGAAALGPALPPMDVAQARPSLDLSPFVLEGRKSLPGSVGTEIFFGKSEIRLDTPVDKQPDGQIT